MTTSLSLSVGFSPISGPSARVLILGSLPGDASIKRQEYYAQPRNTFWRIMGDLFDIAPALPYEERVAALIANRIAVWDVCAAAHRSGSLDSDIVAASVEVNDFKRFFSEHANLSLICFNGTKAGALYGRRVMPYLTDDVRRISRKVLPSTSPALASLSYETKRAAWEIVLQQEALPSIDIIQVRTQADTASVAELFREYAASIGVDLEYQEFSAELLTLPGRYAPPSGDLLLAKVNGEIAGCVALRAMDQSTLEMKRLYVRPSARGTGLGKRLAEAAIVIARQCGYAELRLDTLANMTSAQALYRTLGFVEIAPYGKTYLPGTRFFALSLAPISVDRTDAL